MFRAQEHRVLNPDATSQVYHCFSKDKISRQSESKHISPSTPPSLPKAVELLKQGEASAPDGESCASRGLKGHTGTGFQKLGVLSWVGVLCKGYLHRLA